MNAIDARNVCVRFGRTPILSNVEVTLRAGEVLGLLGPNGAGKSTLIGALAGLTTLSQGAVLLHGNDVHRLNPRIRAKQLALLPQGLECHWPMAAREVVALGRTPHLRAWAQPSKEDARAVERAMHACDVVHLQQRPMNTLSSGERERVLLARALACEAKVLLADEPAAQLDPGHQLDVMNTLRQLARNDVAVGVALHDLSLASRFCDRVALLKDGRVLAAGATVETLTPENLMRCFAIRATRVTTPVGDVLVPLEHLSERQTDVNGDE